MWVLLLAGDRALGTLAGTRIGTGALTAHRQAAAVPDALVATDLHLAPDVGGNLAAKVTFDLVVGLDEVAQLHDLVVGQVLGSLVGADAGRGERRLRAGAAHPEDIGERDLQPLLAG
jgi:hypothetical protein